MTHLPLLPLCIYEARTYESCRLNLVRSFGVCELEIWLHVRPPGTSHGPGVDSDHWKQNISDADEDGPNKRSCDLKCVILLEGEEQRS